MAIANNYLQAAQQHPNLEKFALAILALIYIENDEIVIDGNLGADFIGDVVDKATDCGLDPENLEWTIIGPTDDSSF
jgi:hypothetical protein